MAKRIPVNDKEREFRAEAEGLALLPVEEQTAILALHRSVADDPQVSKSNRREACERLEALERLLKLKGKKKSKES